MSAIIAVVTIFFGLAAGLGIVAFVVYRRILRRAKAIERGLKMVPILIHMPPPSEDTVASGREVRDVMREKTAQAEVLYSLLAGTAKSGFKSSFYGQRHLALEIIAIDGIVHFYAAVPIALVAVAEQAIQTAYPGARLEEVEDHNVFSKAGQLAATLGGEITTKFEPAYPVATYKQLERDPLEAILNTLSALKAGEGAALQVLIRPAGNGWVKRSTALVKKKLKGEKNDKTFTPGNIAQALVKPPEHKDESKPAELTGLERSVIELMEDKAKSAGFEALIRVVVSTAAVASSQKVLQELANAFSLYEAPGLNGFRFVAAPNPQALVDAFIFRFFPPEMGGMVLNTVELATLFHLPDAQFTPTANVVRQAAKQVDGPATMPTTGLLLGYNEFRDKRTEVRLSDEDRRRHTYIIGQTGTGKSTMLENLIVQDMLSGRGFAFIDPHGDSAEKLLGLVPKSRAEDVIYFNPADTESPLGLNLFEFADPAQKDFLIQESLGMLYKIYDPNGQGTIGPRFEQWYRNAALTLMSDPAGSTFIEIPKVFTDTDYLKAKFKYLTDPTVIEFWTKEMGQTSDYHKSEMLGYFVSKFGAFQQNETMRNIMGQTKSAFNLREVMDQKKILIVNLSKGQIGELNSKLLGMIFVIKFQAAAMSRASMPEADRNDFCLYVDEFQNFSTDSFASILSEARKYRLNLIVANQFIGQLSTEIRDAVFGNIGTVICHRTGPEDAEFMVRQFAPIFEARDLVNLPNFQSAVRVMVGGLPSQPFTMSDLPFVTGSSLELGTAVKELSAAKFGQPKAVVEADIARRLATGGGVPAPTPAPAPVSVPTPVAAPAPVVAPKAQVVASTAPVSLPPAAPPPPVREAVPSAPSQVVPPIQPAVAASVPPVASVVTPPAVSPPPAAVEPANPSTLGLADIVRVGGATAQLPVPTRTVAPPMPAPAPPVAAPVPVSTPLPVSAVATPSDPPPAQPLFVVHGEPSIADIIPAMPIATDQAAPVGAASLPPTPAAASAWPEPAAAVSPSPVPLPPPSSSPGIGEIADEAQEEIDELLEASHLAKPVRHRLPDKPPVAVAEGVSDDKRPQQPTAVSAPPAAMVPEPSATPPNQISSRPVATIAAPPDLLRPVAKAESAAEMPLPKPSPPVAAVHSEPQPAPLPAPAPLSSGDNKPNNTSLPEPAPLPPPPPIPDPPMPVAPEPLSEIAKPALEVPAAKHEMPPPTPLAAIKVPAAPTIPQPTPPKEAPVPPNLMPLEPLLPVLEAASDSTSVNKPAAEVPQLAPGEIYVDGSGNVHQGGF